MRKFLCIFISLLTLSSCHLETDKIVEETTDSIYVSKINMFTGQPQIRRYHQPKFYKGVVEGKRQAVKPRKRYIRVNIGHKTIYLRRSDSRYFKIEHMRHINIGDSVLIKETFYPFYRMELVKIFE